MTKKIERDLRASVGKVLKETKDRLPNEDWERLAEIMNEDSDEYMSRILPLQASQADYRHLEYIAYLLNTPQIDDEGKLLPQSYILKQILEPLVGKSPSELEWIKGNFESLLSGSEYTPAPRSPLSYFNRFAKEHPLVLKVFATRNKDGSINIKTGLDSDSSPVARVLWLICQEYLSSKDKDRLKRCSYCERWFVDRTNNKNKKRCSNECTWSWDRRKKEYGADRKQAKRAWKKYPAKAKNREVNRRVWYDENGVKHRIEPSQKKKGAKG